MNSNLEHILGEKSIPRVLQWKYTSSRYNIEKSAGFFTFSMSERLTKGEKGELVEKVAHYNAPESLPTRPTKEDLAKFPVAFSYFRLSNGKSVLCRTCYIGLDYATSRYGNFFAHALILEKGNWTNPLRYFRSPAFASGLTKEEIELTDAPPPLPELSVNDVPFSDKPLASLAKLDEGEFGVLKRMVDGFHTALRTGSNLVFYLDESRLLNAPALLELFLSALPEEVAKKVCFSTYVHNPSYEPLLNDRREYCFVAFAPSSVKEHIYSDKFVSVDLSGMQALAKEEYRAKNVYARQLSPSFVTNVTPKFPNPDAPLSSGIDDLTHNLDRIRRERDSDRAYLENLGTLDELLRGMTPDARGYSGVWKMLYALLATHTDLVYMVVKKLLTNDYSGRASSAQLFREILAFSVRARLGHDNQVIDRDPNESIRAICAFWRKHIPQDPKGLNAWRAKSYEEIHGVFGVDSAAAQVVQKSCSCIPYLYEFLEQNVRSNDPALLWLTLALGVYAAVNEPSELPTGCVSALRKASARLRASALQNQFEEVFFEKMATSIIDPDSYTPLFEFLGEKDTLGPYIASGHFNECASYWRQGVGVPKAGEDSQEYNPLLDAPVEEEEEESTQLVLVDSRRVAPNTKQAAKRTAAPAPTTRLPGADALVLWLVNEKKYEILSKQENLFKGFKRKHFRRAKRYFGSKAGYKGSAWANFEEEKFPRNYLLMTFIGVTLMFCLFAGGVAAFFVYTTPGKNLWHRLTTKDLSAPENPSAGQGKDK